jgi:hypothetical protein
MNKIRLRTKKDDKEYDVTIDEDNCTFSMPTFAKEDWIFTDKFFEEKTEGEEVHYSVTKEVPESCIESAEFILQTFHGREPPDWSAEEQVAKPSIYAHFGDGGVINITESENAVDELSGKKELPFPEIEGGGYEAFVLGTGLILGNVTEKDYGDYNMHLGSFVASQVDKKAAIISDVSEPEGDVKLIKPWRITGIQKPDDYRGKDYENKDVYKIGLLLANPKLPTR